MKKENVKLAFAELEALNPNDPQTYSLDIIDGKGETTEIVIYVYKINCFC